MSDWKVGDKAYASINGEVVSGKINAFFHGGLKIVRFNIYYTNVNILRKTREEAQIEVHKHNISTIKSMIEDQYKALQKEELRLEEAEKDLLIVKLAKIK